MVTTKNKVALVHCPSSNLHLPLGIAYLKSALGARQDVICIDLNLAFYKLNHQYSGASIKHFDSYYFWSQEDINDFERSCEKAYSIYTDFFLNWAHHLSQYNIIGFSTWVGNVVATKILCSLIKNINPQATIIAGGPSIFRQGLIFPDYMLKSRYFDVCVFGIGEDIIYDLVSALENKSSIRNIPGLSYLECNSIITTDKKDTKLSELFCPPDFSDFNLHDYAPTKDITLPIYTAIGCVGRCEYCNIYTYYDKFKSKTIDAIKNEIKYLRDKHGQKYTNFEFLDSLGFPVSKRSIMELITFGIEQNITFYFQVRIMPYLCDEEIISALAKSRSCIQVGFESASSNVRQKMGKFENDEIVNEFFTLCFKHDVNIYLNIITGYPCESTEDFKKTFDFVKWFFTSSTSSTMWVSPFLVTFDFYEKYGAKSDAHGHWFTIQCNIRDRIWRAAQILQFCHENNFLPRLNSHSMETVEGINVPNPLRLDKIKNEIDFSSCSILASQGDMDVCWYFEGLLVIKGWIIDDVNDCVPEDVILINSINNDILGVAKVSECRPDIAQSLKKSHLENSGWSLSCFMTTDTENAPLKIYGFNGSALIDCGISPIYIRNIITPEIKDEYGNQPSAINKATNQISKMDNFIGKIKNKLIWLNTKLQ